MGGDSTIQAISLLLSPPLALLIEEFAVFDPFDFVPKLILDGRVGAGDKNFAALLRVENPLVVFGNKPESPEFGVVLPDIEVRNQPFPSLPFLDLLEN